MAPLRQIAAGSIHYQISLVRNPDYRGGRVDLFSDELRAEIQRRNAPDARAVHFDGRHSRKEEINSDYGVRSQSTELRVAGRPTVTYCKVFPFFNFCIEHPILPRPGGPPPDLAPTGETATIAGLRCRKAEYHGDRHLFVWYSDEVTANDPTGAVLQPEGVPGLVLQTEEIPVSDAVDLVQRVTVTEVRLVPPPPQLFSVPEHYRHFPDIDAVRAEDRRILKMKSAEELQRNPPNKDEQAMFAGRWLLKRPKDQILVEVTPTGDSEFRFRTTVLTAPSGVTGRVSEEQAIMVGRTLMVEDPPNYRLYKMEDEGQKLVLAGNDLFSFSRL